MAKILVTDLDGTLFYPKKKLGLIGKENLAFLREWIDSGNKLVLASGRNYKDADKILKKIGREAHRKNRSRRITVFPFPVFSYRQIKGSGLIDDTAVFTDRFIPAVDVAVQTSFRILVAAVPGIIGTGIHNQILAFNVCI